MNLGAVCKNVAPVMARVQHVKKKKAVFSNMDEKEIEPR
jgi:hypothetical protein